MSGLPRLAVCPGSSALPLAASASEWAELGHERHALIETAINAGEIEKLPEEIRALLPNGANAKTEVAVAYDYERDTARWLGQDIGRQYLIGATEVAGTVDLFVEHEGAVTIADWKGYDLVADPDRNPQLLGYALAIARLTGASELRLVVMHVEESDGEIHLLRAPIVRVVDAIDLDSFAVALRGIVRAVEEQKTRTVPDVRESKHCKWCDHMPHCPAKRELLVRITSGQERDELEGMLPLTPQTVAVAYERLKHAEHLLKRIRNAIYGFASEIDVPLGNGRVLGRRMKLGPTQLDGDAVYQVVREKYGQEAADQAVTREATQARLEIVLKARGVKPLAPAMRDVMTEVHKRGGSKRTPKETTDEHALELPERVAG